MTAELTILQEKAVVKEQTMQVAIIEIKTGKVVGLYPILVGGQNYTPTEEEYISEAWRCAVDDELVDADSRTKYRFSLSE